MADAPKILGTDTLRTAYPKLNNIIDLVNAFDEQIDSIAFNIDYVIGMNNNRVVTTMENGRLVRVEEISGTTVVKSSTLGYDSNGTLVTVTEVLNGKTTISTLNYSNGILTSVSRVTT